MYFCEEICSFGTHIYALSISNMPKTSAIKYTPQKMTTISPWTLRTYVPPRILLYSKMYQFIYSSAPQTWNVNVEFYVTIDVKQPVMEAKMPPLGTKFLVISV